MRTVRKIREKCKDDDIVVLREDQKYTFYRAGASRMHYEEDESVHTYFPARFCQVSQCTRTYFLPKPGYPVNRARSIKTAYSWKFGKAIYFLFLSFWKRCFKARGWMIRIRLWIWWPHKIFRAILLKRASSQVSSRDPLFLIQIKYFPSIHVCGTLKLRMKRWFLDDGVSRFV